MDRIRVFMSGLVMMVTCVGCCVSAGELHKVTTMVELQQALAAASKGREITLASGDYGLLSVRDLKAPLVLRSADPTRPARFSGMVLRNVSNVTIDGVVFDYTYQLGDKKYLRPFQILSSTGVMIRNSLFDGDLWRGGGVTDDGFSTAFGLGVRFSSDITLEGNEIRNFYRGTVISQSQNVVVRGTNMHSLRMDGMNFTEVSDVLIEKNHIHDFTRSVDSEDHADMIQFWTNGTKSPSRNITIRDNLLNSGKGWYTQSIFMRNEMVDRGLAGHEMFYRNVTIKNNMIINAHLHGITVGETDGLIIQNNTVVRNFRSEGKRKNKTLWIPQIRVKGSSRNVELSRNITSKIDGYDGQLGWSVHDNFFAQDSERGKAGFYGYVFDSTVLSDPSQPEAFVPRKGGPLDGMGLGAQQPVL
ncbi:right-handed parallel beta-helix repeat-containing protein [Roseobacter sp. N2S]|uniref:right-handed parallel beta-helix repeat-containing protein n=1 Tax=Roseobacter sp. N2S TaxID=2663844 RepID=UPI002866511B|nr:right-handed parallel beta-helix repeat-containing protein [Roseobacter sp. N2S]MDR6267656.1 hypothetical protein [Roseobacter sp. N2S]